MITPRIYNNFIYLPDLILLSVRAAVITLSCANFFPTQAKKFNVNNKYTNLYFNCNSLCEKLKGIYRFRFKITSFSV